MLRIKSYRNCLSPSLLLKYTTWGRISISSHIIVTQTDHKEGRKSGAGSLDQPHPALRVPEMIGLPWRTLESTRVTSKLKVFSRQGKCQCWDTPISIFLRTSVRPRGRSSDHPKAGDMRAVRSSSVNRRWRRPRCNDTRPGTFKEEVPRDGCRPRCYRSCCPSNSNMPSALRTVACRGLTHGSAPRAGTLRTGVQR